MTDHRINLTAYNLNRMIEGEIEPLIEALRDHDLDARMKREIAAA